MLCGYSRFSIDEADAWRFPNYISNFIYIYWNFRSVLNRCVFFLLIFFLCRVKFFFFVVVFIQCYVSCVGDRVRFVSFETKSLFPWIYSLSDIGIGLTISQSHLFSVITCAHTHFLSSDIILCAWQCSWWFAFIRTPVQSIDLCILETHCADLRFIITVVIFFRILLFLFDFIENIFVLDIKIKVRKKGRCLRFVWSFFLLFVIIDEDDEQEDRGTCAWPKTSIDCEECVTCRAITNSQNNI